MSAGIRIEDFAEAALAASVADETEVVAIRKEENLTRFANNYIHQNVNERSWFLAVRAAIGGRVGTAVSGDPRIENAQRLAARACEIAQFQPENPHFRGFASSEALPIRIPKGDRLKAELQTPSFPVSHSARKLGVWSSAFRRSPSSNGESLPEGEGSIEDRARRVGVVCREAKVAGYVAAGSMTTGTTEMLVSNSRGVYSTHRSMIVDGSTVVVSDTSSGWAQASGCRLGDVNWEALADEAIRKTRLGENPITIEPGTYRVILDPYATADLLGMLAEGMSGLAVQEERSWLNERIGRKIMADNITIVDDGLDSAGIPQPFDAEGVPKQPVTIVENGIARGPVYDTTTAGRSGLRSTGHATMPSPTDRPGPSPANLFLRPGTSNVEAMIRSMESGLYITRFWYTRYVHPRDVVVTGMTRDGTFVIRNGVIAGAAKPLRFTQSYLDALTSTEAIGTAVKVLRWGSGAITAPAIQLGRFRFTSATQ